MRHSPDDDNWFQVDDIQQTQFIIFVTINHQMAAKTDYKFVVAGDKRVGKSSLLLTFWNNSFLMEGVPTVICTGDSYIGFRGSVIKFS